MHHGGEAPRVLLYQWTWGPVNREKQCLYHSTLLCHGNLPTLSRDLTQGISDLPGGNGDQPVCLERMSTPPSDLHAST